MERASNLSAAVNEKCIFEILRAKNDQITRREKNIFHLLNYIYKK